MIRRIAALLALLLTAGLAQAQVVLYGATGAGVASNLYTISTSNGAATPIGPIGFAVTGMALDRTTNIMYGVTSNNSPGCQRCLITIDLATGAGTVIGPLGLVISEIEFGANGRLYGWSESSDELAVINLSSGAATTIPGSGIGTAGDGMALVGSVMYLMPEGSSGTYYTVDTNTGSVTPVGTLTGSPSPGSNVSAATTSPVTGTVFASIISGFIVAVNINTGVMTNVGATVGGIDALAFGPYAGVPTLSEWALLALALVLVGFGAWRLRPGRLAQ